MERKHVRVVGAMLQREDGRYLITQRLPTSSLPLLWEFPGGRVEAGESDAQALARELKEEMAIEIEVLEKVMHHQHSYTHYDIDFRVFRCRLRGGEETIQHLKVNDHRWVTLEEMANYRFPDADARTLEKLLGLEPEGG
jgi:8-oxo-dGTP diphosphatase